MKKKTQCIAKVKSKSTPQTKAVSAKTRAPRSKKSQLNDEDLACMNFNAAGIDIGAKEIWVAVPKGRDQAHVRVFSTFTHSLHETAEWLKKCKIDCVAMEATGNFWIPLYEILEAAGIRPVLANARNIKNVSGRKSDISDAEWLATLLKYGLVTGAFRPTCPKIMSLRGYVRQRSLLIEHRAPHINHMNKALIEMNLRLKNVIDDLVGKTGMSIICSIIDGERDPKKLAALRSERCHSSEIVIERSLEGHYKDEQVFALKQFVEAYNLYTKQIEDCEVKIQTVLNSLDDRIIPEVLLTSDVVERKESATKPEAKKRKRNASKNMFQFDASAVTAKKAGVDLTQLDGIGEQTAVLILSEMGTNVSPWPNDKHFASWLGLCPQNDISGGRVLRSRTKRCPNRIAQALRIAAFSIIRSKSALGAFCRRMMIKLGTEKGLTATAHKLARQIYRMLKYGQGYVDIGQEEYDRQHNRRSLRALEKRAKEMGYELVKRQIAA